MLHSTFFRPDEDAATLCIAKCTSISSSLLSSCLYQTSLVSLGWVKLHIPHVRILTALCEQFVVGTQFVDSPILQNNDLVCVFNGTKTVGNHKNSAFASKLVEGVLDRLFCNGVQSTCDYTKAEQSVSVVIEMGNIRISWVSRTCSFIKHANWRAAKKKF